jgi:hypothetical protein
MHGKTASRNDSLERMQSLLQRWQRSLDLHLKYLPLDDAHYWHVQPWPRHERPAAWIVRLAHERVGLLRQLLEQHSARGDGSFAAGLEHMAFLANLVGLQPGERHIPLADPDNEHREALETPAAAPAPRKPAREMPRPRSTRSARDGSDRSAASGRHSTANTTVNALALIEPRERVVIDDAVRLLQWGRQWHELGELISRMAERPGITEVRRTLRAHRARIEAAARAAPPAAR